MGVHAGEDVGRGEEKVVGLPAGGHLVPRDRGRHGGAAPGAQRVGGDGGLGAVVLAPVDEHLARRAATWSSGTPPGRGARSSIRSASAFARALACSAVRPLIAAYSCRPLPPEVFGSGRRPSSSSSGRSASATRQQSTTVAGSPGSRSKTSRSGSAGRRPCSGKPPHRDVQLEGGQVGRPDQRRQVIDDQVADRRRPAPATANCATPRPRCGSSPAGGAGACLAKNDSASTPSG